MTRLMKTITLTTLLALLFVMMPEKPARADLSITPTRIVFQGRGRSATVMLLNQTDNLNTYRIGWLEMKADESGKYALIPAAGDNPHSVAKMVVSSPRQVTIEPGAYQTIRLSLRRPADLPPGEYRAHMSMIRMAKETPAEQDPNMKGQAFSLNVNLGFSIPVIVRIGDDPDLKVEIASPQINPGKGKIAAFLGIDIKRLSGKFSTYGTVKVFLQQPGHPEKLIGSLNNTAVYPELQQRHIDIPLDESPESGNLHIVYVGKYESEGKIWDDKVFPITK